MKMNEQNHRSAGESKELARTVDFEGHRVTTVMWNGRPAWLTQQVGEALGYADGRLAERITGEWSEEFILGTDCETLSGADLAAFKALTPELGVSRAPSLAVLYESGLHLAALKTRKPAGKRLRRMLAEHVLPQLVRTGTASLVDGLSMVEMVRAMMKESAAQMRTEILAEIRGAPPANQLPDALPFLDRRARSMVLTPIMVVAKTYAGPGADHRRVMQERGRFDKKLRDALGWQRRWCFYPTHELGRLAALIETELSTANRVATELTRARQLDLVPRPKLPSRGDA